MLRWIEAGDGVPAVVFEAGAASPVIGFAACLTALAPDHRVIAYDRGGYGVSDPVPLGLDQQVGDLVAVLEAAGPSILVGHSWGGLLAELAAWEHPELIAGLVLVDPSHESIHSLHAKLAPPQVVAEMRRHPSRSAPRARIRAALTCWSPLAPVLEPMMAVQDELVAAANGRHVVVPDAGHDLHVDRPDLVIQAVRDVAGVG